MSEGRALLTERERAALAGELSDSYRYKTRTYVRRRLDKLATDLETLAEHDPELYQYALDTLGGDAPADASPGRAGRERRESAASGDGSPSPTDTAERGKEPDHGDTRADAEPEPTDGPDTADTRGESDPMAGSDPLAYDAMDIPQGKKPGPCLDAVYAARDFLREHGPASAREIVAGVMPDHSLGYDVPELEPGDRYRGAWWRRIVQPGLKALPDVEYRSNYGDYRVTEASE